MPLEAVTVSKDAGPTERRRARAVARRLGLPFRETAPGARYVVGRRGEWVLGPDDRRLAAHPGLFVQKMAVGPEHPLLRAVAPVSLRPDPLRLDGLRVLDGTAGLGQDALHLAGAGAQVVAVERVPVLGCLLRGFLRHARVGGVPWSEAAARMRVVIGEVEAALSTMSPGAVDVVLLDPMFEAPRRAAPDYDLFRAWASPEPLGPDALEAATRVARARVVWKVPEGAAPSLPEGALARFERRVSARAFDYWIVEKVLERPVWAPLRRRRRADPHPTPPGER